MRKTPEAGVIVRSGGSPDAPFDVWFHPAFGDSWLSYRHAFASPLVDCARVFVFDPPGHGASPPRAGGLTIAAAARIWCALLARLSESRRVVLVGHSMAGIIASVAAARLTPPPVLVVSVEGNLTRADAYYSGQAARYGSHIAFHAALTARIRRAARRDAVLGGFACNLDAADSRTLWTLGRSIAARPDPGAAFRRLRSPRIHYWDSARAARHTRDYIAQYGIPNRRLDGLGHWPMLKAPGRFYAALCEDIFGNQRSARARA